jgi:hypothetical protein
LGFEGRWKREYFKAAKGALRAMFSSGYEDE